MTTTMQLADHSFEHVCDIEPLRDAAGTLTQFMPQQRYRNVRSLPLNRYGVGPFCKFSIPRRYQTSGVYALTADGELRYIGECSNLAARFNAGYGNISPKNCYRGGQETNCRLNNLLYGAFLSGERIELWFSPTRDYKVVEIALRRAFNPVWNRV